MGDLNDLERPRLGDDLKQHPHHPQLPVIDPADGLPKMATATTMADSLAPALTLDTFVCMADEGAFQSWSGICYDISGHQSWNTGRKFLKERAVFQEKLGGWYVLLTPEEIKAMDISQVIDISGEKWAQVQPIRPQCEYYKRVMTDFESQDGIKQVERVCTAQRTEGGEYVSLRDTRVYACEHRSPPDFVSAERLRKFDQERLQSAQKQTEEFDVEAALAAASGEKK